MGFLTCLLYQIPRHGEQIHAVSSSTSGLTYSFFSLTKIGDKRSNLLLSGETHIQTNNRLRRRITQVVLSFSDCSLKSPVITQLHHANNATSLRIEQRTSKWKRILLSEVEHKTEGFQNGSRCLQMFTTVESFINASVRRYCEMSPLARGISFTKPRCLVIFWRILKYHSRFLSHIRLGTVLFPIKISCKNILAMLWRSRVSKRSPIPK